MFAQGQCMAFCVVVGRSSNDNNNIGTVIVSTNADK